MLSKRFGAFIMGTVCGASSWLICPLLSKNSNPFDTSIGFYSGQIMLVITAVFVTTKNDLTQLFLLVFGMYIGMNMYVYFFGSSDEHAYFILGLFTSSSLVVYPLAAGYLSNIIKKKTDIGRIIRAFSYSLNGLKTAVHSEAAFRQELYLLGAGSIAAFCIPVSIGERVALIGCLIVSTHL